MFHVISCDKYHRQTIRLVETDTQTREEIMNGAMGECVLCGSCSHVEVGPRKDHWTIHTSLATKEQAVVALWKTIDASPDKYATSDLPPRPVEAVTGFVHAY